jgi:hypothetical protein
MKPRQKFKRPVRRLADKKKYAEFREIAECKVGNCVFNEASAIACLKIRFE